METFRLTHIQGQILNFMIEQGKDMRRIEMVKSLNIPRTTIFDNLIKLSKKGLVERFEYNNHKKGRPLTFWKLKPLAIEMFVKPKETLKPQKIMKTKRVEQKFLNEF